MTLQYVNSRSESLSQVFLITIGFLYATLQKRKVPQERWSKLFLVYDNMCQLNSLRAAKEALPLPKPFDRMWEPVNKCIDGFHLRNHVDPTCRLLYSPSRITEVNPELKSANTEEAEEAFAWLKKLQYNTYSMPKLHHLFFIHRLLKTRNLHLEEESSGKTARDGML